MWTQIWSKTKSLQLVGLAADWAEFKFELEIKPLPVIWQSLPCGFQQPFLIHFCVLAKATQFLTAIDALQGFQWSSSNHSYLNLCTKFQHTIIFSIGARCTLSSVLLSPAIPQLHVGSISIVKIIVKIVQCHYSRLVLPGNACWQPNFWSWMVKDAYFLCLVNENTTM